MRLKYAYPGADQGSLVLLTKNERVSLTIFLGTNFESIKREPCNIFGAQKGSLGLKLLTTKKKWAPYGLQKNWVAQKGQGDRYVKVTDMLKRQKYKSDRNIKVQECQSDTNVKVKETSKWQKFKGDRNVRVTETLKLQQHQSDKNTNVTEMSKRQIRQK